MPKTLAEAARRLEQTFAQKFPAEVGQILNGQTAAQICDFLRLQHHSASVSILQSLDPDIATDVFMRLSDEELMLYIGEMDISSAAILLNRLAIIPRLKILKALPKALRTELEELIQYPAESAGSIMDPLVTVFTLSETVENARKKMRSRPERRIYDLCVVDDTGKFAGMVPLRKVALASATDTLGMHVESNVSTIQTMASKEEVVELLEHNKFTSLAVTDFEGRLAGVIRHAELLGAIQQEAFADLQTMVGASREERALSKVSFAVRKRAPWLFINLLTAFLAASVVGLFENTIAQFTALAVLLPVVAGQSGNTGAQALAVILRGLSLREIRPRQWLSIITKESLVGLLNGTFLGLACGLGVYVWSGSGGLAIIISVSMVLAMTIACIAGAAIPVLLTALKQDPAQSSSIILTTVTDVIGFLSFLGLATLLSNLLAP